MPEKLSLDPSLKSQELRLEKLKLNKIELLMMIGMGYLPFIHLSLSLVVPIIFAFYLPAVGMFWGVFSGILTFYLLPPLCLRLLVPDSKKLSGGYEIGSKKYLIWWLSLQLQMNFNRLGFLEEVLRIVPGLYSAWLRLWGAKIGKLVYWSPGTILSDRQLLKIGDQVVIGAGTKLIPHFMNKDSDDRLRLFISNIEIGDRAVIGGYSLLVGGVSVKADEVTLATKTLRDASILKLRGDWDAN